MRALLLASMIFVSQAALADIFPGVPNVVEIPSGRPGVYKFRIKEGPDGSWQAAAYTEPNLTELYARHAQEYRPLRDKLAAIYHESGCTPDGKYEDKEMGDLFCGEVSSLGEENTVLWNFARGGWMEAYATRKTFLTFMSAGSGRFTEPVLELTTSVGVVGVNQPDENTPAVFEVTIDMTGFKDIQSN